MASNFRPTSTLSVFNKVLKTLFIWDCLNFLQLIMVSLIYSLNLEENVILLQQFFTWLRTYLSRFII